MRHFVRKLMVWIVLLMAGFVYLSTKPALTAKIQNLTMDGFGKKSVKENPKESKKKTSSSLKKLEATNGFFPYYNQTDSKWGKKLYGEKDPIATHGCGPTALAMVVSYFTDTKILPDKMAVWAYKHGYCVTGAGSLHTIVPEGGAEWGLKVKSLKVDKASLLKELQSGHVIVALMDKGYFTNKGHFLILIKATEDGKLKIADPVSVKNSKKEWDVDFILNELRENADAGGPLWSISMGKS